MQTPACSGRGVAGVDAAVVVDPDADDLALPTTFTSTTATPPAPQSTTLSTPTMSQAIHRLLVPRPGGVIDGGTAPPG
jgi:hypothetical protein